MKLSFNPKTKMPDIKLEEGDFADGVRIQEMMKGEFLCRKCGSHYDNKAWDILLGYFQSQRLILEEKMKGSIETRAGKDGSPVQIAKLVGFDHFMGLPDRIIDQMEMMQEALNIKKEKDNDRNGNAYGD